MLHEASVNTSKASIERIRSKLGFQVEQVSVMQKCNSILVVATYFGEFEPDFVRGRVLSAWDDEAMYGIENAYRHLKFFHDDDALKYIVECSLGLHSVTPGDAQVLHQVCDSLSQAAEWQREGFMPFQKFVTQIRKLSTEAKSQTKLYLGNTSLERIAAEKIKSKTDSLSQVLVVGAGRTGALMVKILSQELGLKVLLANRSKAKKEALIKKYPNISSFDAQKNDLADIGCVVIAVSDSSEAREYISNILTGLSHKTVILDLSSPSITNTLGYSKRNNVVTIEEISNEAMKSRLERKSEVDKVRAIVDREMPSYIESLTREVAKFHSSNNKKNGSIKLDERALKILSIRSVCNDSIRKFYSKQGFTEVTTPYIVSVSSDPPRVDRGSAFKIDWSDGSTAFLRQSNQLYKQMIVASGLDKIYEIGPFWRKEEKTTYRHLAESMGLDVEYSNPASLEEVYNLAYSTILELDKKIRKKAKVKQVLHLPAVDDIPTLTYSECIELLRSKGYSIRYGQDLGLIGESRLGQIISKERHSDAFIVINYPDNIKKFYTKKKAGGETETFDIIVDGWELVSGALRNTNRIEIEKSMLLSGVNIADYDFYLSIVSGSAPHGGFCLGLDRLISKTIGLEIVAESTPFPRTAETLIP